MNNEVAIDLTEEVNPTVTSHPSIPICEHIKDDGHRCGSPAIRGRHFCYHHSRAHAPSYLGARGYRAPVLETIHSIQVHTKHINDALGSGRINHKVAGKLLYGVQLSTNLLKMANGAASSPSIGKRAKHMGAPFKPSVGLSGEVQEVGAPFKPSVGLGGEVQNLGNPDNDHSTSQLVTEITPAMLEVLSPSPDEPVADLTDSESFETFAEPVPIPPAAWKRITADLLGFDEHNAIKETLYDGDTNPDYDSALKLIQAHYAALEKLEEFGMSTHHPRLRKWFPRVPSAHHQIDRLHLYRSPRE